MSNTILERGNRRDATHPFPHIHWVIGCSPHFPKSFSPFWDDKQYGMQHVSRRGSRLCANRILSGLPLPSPIRPPTLPQYLA